MRFEYAESDWGSEVLSLATEECAMVEAGAEELVKSSGRSEIVEEPKSEARNKRLPAERPLGSGVAGVSANACVEPLRAGVPV